MLIFPQDGRILLEKIVRRILLEKIVWATLVNSFPGSTESSAD